MIDTLGYDLKLDSEFEIRNFEGFLPCVLNGYPDIGFEFYCENAETVIKDDPSFKDLMNAKDTCISLTWGGSFKDYAAVLIICCALAKSADAVISYEGEAPETLDNLLDAVDDAIHRAEKVEEENSKKQQVLANVKAGHESVEKILQEKLSALAGAEITHVNLFGNLMLRFSNEQHLIAKAYKLIIPGQTIDVASYAKIRSKQIDILTQYSEAEINVELEAELEQLNNQLDQAMEDDESNNEKIKSEIESWPEKVTVKQASLLENNVLKIVLSELDKTYFELHTFDSMLSDITLGFERLQFKITPDDVKLI